MPYELGTIWNITSKYIYNTLNKNIGIGTTIPISELDVYGDISEKGISLKEKYELKPENNKKYDLIVREDLAINHSDLIIWYKFNKEDFTTNYANIQYGTLKGNPSIFQSEYYVGTGSAEINDELYYKIEMTNSQFNSESYTFCFWLFLNEECDNNKYILNLIDANGDIFNFKYQIDKLIINKNANSIEYNYSLDKNKWHHISIIISDANSSDKRILLVNGIRINNTSDSITGVLLRNTGKDGSADIYLGYISNSINGYIDDFRIYETNLSIDDIHTNIIGKITKITPGNISANGNYGIDVVNYSNLINIGSKNTNVDLTIYGDLTIESNLIIDSITIDSATFNETKSTNIEAISITENNKKLINKYALIGSVDKNTDIIVSKMIDSDDVNVLYNEMPAYFRSNLIFAYNFDYDFDNINNFNKFFRNYTDISIWNTYNITPIIEQQNIIDYYGTKYVKGNASLHCYSNVDGIHYYNFQTISDNDATFYDTKNYTISFWIRFNEIGRIQNIFKIGDNPNTITLKLNNNKLEFINRNNSPITVDDISFKKDEWYHISIILKNKIQVSIPKDDFSDTEDTLIKQFQNLDYTSDTSATDTIKFNHTDISGYRISSLLIYINGIEYKKHNYTDATTTFFENIVATNNFIGVSSSQDTNYLNGFIDDFKIFETIVPIYYINKHIIGDALVIKPGQLSAIGNYGINIENFNNLVSIGNNYNQVDLHIYGLLKVVNDTLTIANVDIYSTNNKLLTSNLEISDLLNVNSNIANNINVNNVITGNGFVLGRNDYINDIIIGHIKNNYLYSSNIIADDITINNELILKTAILSNVNIVNINLNNAFKTIDNNIFIYSNLSIGDTTSNLNRFDLGNYIGDNTVEILGGLSILSKSFYNVENNGGNLTTIDNSIKDIQIYEKSLIFYGSDNTDIHFKNNYIRDSSCNILDEIDKSFDEDRDKTRIKIDVGNVKIQNGFIEIRHFHPFYNRSDSKIKLSENNIYLSNNQSELTLTPNSLIFNNGNGFINNDTLRINNININNIVTIPSLTTQNTDHSVYSINTSNEYNPFGRILGFLHGDSKIDINYEIRTTSNIHGDIIYANNTDIENINCDYITCTNKITAENILEVSNLVVTGNINFGVATTGNSINGGDGTLAISTIDADNINVTTKITTANLEADDIIISSDGNIVSPNINVKNISINRIDTNVQTAKQLKFLNTTSVQDASITQAPGIILENNEIKCYDSKDETNYITLHGTGLRSTKASTNTKDIVSYDSSSGEIVVSCDKLQVTQFTPSTAMFSFPNIIAYGQYTTDSDVAKHIPNVYIGSSTSTYQTNIIDNTKDVLYVDTPNETRVRTNNLFVKKIEIGNEFVASTPTKMIITTISSITENSSGQTIFSDQDSTAIITCSLDNHSVAIGPNATPEENEIGIRLFVDGGIQASGDIIAFKNFSDSRLKHNIKALQTNIDIINKLQPVSFTWNSNIFNSNMANKDDIGFIAQEIKLLIPEAVSECKVNTENYNYINYERIIPYLVNNIKYLNNKIVELENKLNGI